MPADGKVPKVRLAKPTGRPFQLRYTCPKENREVRISTGTHDEAEAMRQKAELEAKLLLGIPAKRKRKDAQGPAMPWEYFRERFRELHLVELRDASADVSESRLNIAAEILKPRTLGDLANTEALERLRSELLRGAHRIKGREGKPRSAHTVKSYMATIMAAVNWAASQGYIAEAPKIQRVKTSKLKHMKGRPLTDEEFEAMLKAVPEVVGEAAARSWCYLVRGIWESGLRIGELMHFSWDVPDTIQPAWPKGELPVLHFPAHMQKNDTLEDTPLLPGLERLLLETPEADRTGWIFNPESLQGRIGRKARHERVSEEWAGKVIERIGKKAEIVVVHANPRTGAPVKHASAHDLRRGLGQRLRRQGVPLELVSVVLRHASTETTKRHYAPGETQTNAKQLRAYLGTSDAAN